MTSAALAARLQFAGAATSDGSPAAPVSCSLVLAHLPLMATPRISHLPACHTLSCPSLHSARPLLTVRFEPTLQGSMESFVAQVVFPLLLVPHTPLACLVHCGAVGGGRMQVYKRIPRAFALCFARFARCLSSCGVVLTSTIGTCLLYTSPSPRDGLLSRMPSSA